jgi:hypothetical protein
MAGIYNPALFGAAERKARNNLGRMAGIMASSPELMRAVAEEEARAMPRAPAPAMRPMQPMPVMPPMQMAMPMVQPMPMAPAPVMQQPMAPAPVMQQPMAAQPVPQPRPQAPVRMQEGGVVPTPAPAAGPVDISQDPFTFIQGLRQAVAEITPSAMPLVTRKIEKIGVAYAQDDQEKLKDELTSAFDVPPTKAGLEQVYSEAVGEPAPKNASIDELNNRIMTVALGGALASPGSTAERFAKAMIFGLGQQRDTEIARAAARAGGKGQGVSPLEPFPDAVREMAGKIIQQGFVDDASQAVAMAEAALRPLYERGVMPAATPASPAGGGAEPTTEMHIAANNQAKQAGQRTYMLNGVEYDVQ